MQAKKSDKPKDAGHSAAQAIRQWVGRLRQWRRRRREAARRAALHRADAVALTAQAPPAADRVLLLRLDSIGDYLLFRPWLRQLAAEVHGRGQHLTLAANALWAPLALAWDVDCFDALLPVEAGRFGRDLGYRAGVLARIGAGGYGQVINPVHVRSEALESFVRLLRAPVRVASHGPHLAGEWFAALDAGYTHLLPTDPATRFEYVRNGEFFENWRRLAAALAAGKPAGLAETFAPLPAAVADEQLAHRMAAGAPLGLPAAVRAAGAAEAAAGPYAVLFPGASARQKRWPTRAFGELARQLHQRHGAGLRLVLAGSAADAGLAAEVERVAGPAVPLVNRCGRTDLPALAALLAGARLVVSNDTAAAHFAVQAGTPALVLLLGENYGKFFPYPPALLRAPARCLFPPSQEARFARGHFGPPPRDPDLGRLEVARVLAAANDLLTGQ